MRQNKFWMWTKVILLSAVMLTVIVCVMMGVQAVVIDTGRAIVH